MALNIRNLSLEAAYQEFNNKLTIMDNMAADFRADCASSAVPITRFWALIDTINKFLADLAIIVAKPGFAAYVTSQGGSTTPVADYNATRNAMIALRNGINDLIPVDGSGFELVLTKQADGSRAPRTFPTVTTAPLLPLCDALTDSLI